MDSSAFWLQSTTTNSGDYSSSTAAANLSDVQLTSLTIKTIGFDIYFYFLSVPVSYTHLTLPTNREV